MQVPVTVWLQASKGLAQLHHSVTDSMLQACNQGTTLLSSVTRTCLCGSMNFIHHEVLRHKLKTCPELKFQNKTKT
jgi:hypothetical protein